MCKDRNEDKQPMISVIMPAYNCEKYIELAIRSVLCQTHRNLELIVLNDCSSDRTREIAEAVALEDQRVIVLENPSNMGVSRTRNRGLDMCRGEYVCFLDSDDVWRENKLSVQLKKMLETGTCLCAASYAIIDENGNPCKKDYVVPEFIELDTLLCENVIGCSTVMITAEIAKKYRFATDFYHEDYCLWLDILRDGYKAIGCTELLAEWRLIENSRSFNKRRSAMNRWRILKNHLKLPLPKCIYFFFKYMIGGIKKYYA